jgi:peroxiredoxin
MNSRATWVAIIACALFAAGAGFWVGSHAPGHQVDDTTTRLLFKQTWPDAAGKPVGLEQFRGKVVVLNFWATWCPPCVEEIPEFSRVHTELQSQGVQFLGLAVDTAENVAKFVSEVPASYPMLVGGTNAIELARMLGDDQSALPYTLIIDREGHLSSRHLGRLQERELRAALAPLLARP